MASDYNSKHGIVSKSPFELYMAFVDMSNFVKMLPEDKRASVQADYDTISVSVQGISIGARVVRRQPYSRIEFEDNGAPFGFHVNLCFDATTDPGKTEFYIEAMADLNFIMKTILGPKIREALDKIVDSMVDISEGRMPEGVDPDMLKNVNL